MSIRIALCAAALAMAACAQLPNMPQAANERRLNPLDSASAGAYQAKDYCLKHCAAMSDRDRFDYFAKKIWAPYVADWKGHLDSRSQAVGITLQLDPSGKHWEQAAQDAGMFAKVSSGVWEVAMTATPKETVKEMADLASASFKETPGSGEAVIKGVLQAGNPRIEIRKR